MWATTRLLQTACPLPPGDLPYTITLFCPPLPIPQPVPSPSLGAQSAAPGGPAVHHHPVRQDGAAGPTAGQAAPGRAQGGGGEEDGKGGGEEVGGTRWRGQEGHGEASLCREGRRRRGEGGRGECGLVGMGLRTCSLHTPHLQMLLFCTMIPPPYPSLPTSIPPPSGVALLHHDACPGCDRGAVGLARVCAPAARRLDGSGGSGRPRAGVQQSRCVCVCVWQGGGGEGAGGDEDAWLEGEKGGGREATFT